jgi:predicted nuclease of predicted toxin-antitoxin system
MTCFGPKESLRGEPGNVILARSPLEGRLVVTQDKDFGELAFRFGLPAQCGVLLLRLTGVK